MLCLHIDAGCSNRCVLTREIMRQVRIARPMLALTLIAGVTIVPSLWNFANAACTSKKRKVSILQDRGGETGCSVNAKPSRVDFADRDSACFDAPASLPSLGVPTSTNTSATDTAVPGSLLAPPAPAISISSPNTVTSIKTLQDLSRIRIPVGTIGATTLMFDVLSNVYSGAYPLTIISIAGTITHTY
jgi:hypothetical protein